MGRCIFMSNSALPQFLTWLRTDPAQPQQRRRGKGGNWLCHLALHHIKVSLQEPLLAREMKLSSHLCSH